MLKTSVLMGLGLNSMYPQCIRDLIVLSILSCHYRDVAEIKQTEPQVTVAGKAGNIWYAMNLPEELVTALVTVLAELPQLTQLRIEVTR